MRKKTPAHLADDQSAEHVLNTPAKIPPAGFDAYGRAQKHSIALIYCRYSSDMQSPESNAIQEEKCRQWLVRNGYGDLEVVVCCDEELSGTLTDLPGLNRAMALVKAKAVRVMVTVELSRVSRSDSAMRVLKNIHARQTRFVALRDNIDTNVRGWQQSTRFADAHHSSASEFTAMRVRDGQAQRVRDGNGSAGDYSYGYKSDYRDSAEARAASRSRVFRKDVEIDDEQAGHIRTIFSMFNSGVRIPAIVRHLIEKNVKPSRRNKTGWNYGVVRHLLANPKYKGAWTYGATTTLKDGDGIKTQVPADPQDVIVVERPALRIVSDEVFAAAQARLAGFNDAFGMRPDGKQRGPGCDYRILHLNSVTGGLIHCSDCGAKLQVSGSSKDVVRLGCPNHTKGNCGRVVRVVRHLAESLCTAALRECLLAEPAFLAATMAHLKEAVTVAVAEVPQERDRVTAELAAVEKKIANLTDAIADGLGDKAIRDSLKARIAERDVLKARLAGLAPAFAPDLPDEGWVRRQMQDLAAVLPDGDPALLLLVRTCVGRIEADAVVAPGKVRGYTRLRLKIDVPSIVDGLLRRELPAGIALLLPPAADPDGMVELTIDLGKPTRSERVAGQVYAWRQESPPVPWTQICRRLGMPMAQCQIAYRRWRDNLPPGEGTPPKAA